MDIHSCLEETVSSSDYNSFRLGRVVHGDNSTRSASEAFFLGLEYPYETDLKGRTTGIVRV